LAASTVILFSEMLKSSKIKNKNIQRIKSYEGKYLIFKNILFVEMKILELINYLTNMSLSYQRYYGYLFG
jgi:hypothetical protein